MRLTDDLKATIPHVRRFSAMLVGNPSAFDGYLCDYVSGLKTEKPPAFTTAQIRRDMFRTVVGRWRSDGMQSWDGTTATELELPMMAAPLLQGPPDTFAAFILAFVEDFEIEDTAHILGWDLETTRSTIAQAQSTLVDTSIEEVRSTAG